ncbi:MAG: hypothetical protein WKF94_11935 [Solirubrobacteraceae bacterium]
MDRERHPPELGSPAAEHRHGDARRAWSEAFLAYAYEIASHPVYADMPARLDDEGKVDWTIPSNRSPGSKNWDGNVRRREWWAARATAMGIPLEGPWISRVAKTIHPFGWKPCQICGNWMRLSYSYPNHRTLTKLNEHLPPADELDSGTLLDIYEIAEHITSVIGFDTTVTAFAAAFPELRGVSPQDVDELQAAVEERLVLAESRKLSPGAMSNAPDRLDGFHTYNLCCRARQDTGRFSDNLRSYGVDRRAFEHWAEGNWEAANYLMTRTTTGFCARCGREAQLSADHIGPISLGFRHSPYFEPICQPCNSAKNNRMDLRDVTRLFEIEFRAQIELEGVTVAGWQVQELWDRSKERVEDNAAALRLSRLMNVNQHQFLRALLMFRPGAPDALMQFLHPEYAERRVRFVALNRETLTHSGLEYEDRQRTYALMKAARMIRIAFESLDDYALKERRNVSAIPESHLEPELRALRDVVLQAAADPSEWRVDLLEALDPISRPEVRENRLRELISTSYRPDHNYGYVANAMRSYMSKCGVVLAARLDDDQAIKLWADVVEDDDGDGEVGGDGLVS